MQWMRFAALGGTLCVSLACGGGSPDPAALAILTVAPAVRGQREGFDEEAVALAFHRISGEPLDVDVLAKRSPAAQRASGFDRTDVLKAEVARLRGLLESASAAREFVITVNDRIGEYDHESGAFPVELLTPGHFVPFQAFGQEYRLVFANADRARRIPMAKERARAFNARLNGLGRHVTDEIRFRVVGGGEPFGSVSGPRTVRSEIVSARVLDHAGNVMFTADVKSASPAEMNARQFDANRTDVAGLRVGIKAADLEATLNRLYGPARRGPVNAADEAIYAGSVGVNPGGCFSVPGRRGKPRPGTVCIEALFDRDEVVRSVRIERYFSYFDADRFRRALVRKYGPVPVPRGSDAWRLGWGPEVEAGQQALTAYYRHDNDLPGDAMNAAPKVSVTLQLMDAAWLAGKMTSNAPSR